VVASSKECSLGLMMRKSVKEQFCSLLSRGSFESANGIRGQPKVLRFLVGTESFPAIDFFLSFDTREQYTFQDPDDRLDPSDAGPRLSLVLKGGTPANHSESRRSGR